MRKIIILLLIMATIFSLTNIALAEENPRREATKVKDVNQPYTADEWIVSPDDELYTHKKVSNAPECAIKAVIACYDDTYLRTDILLKSSISFDYKVYYGICLSYENMNEYYTYYTATKKLFYDKEKNGKIVESKDLTSDEAGDIAGVTNSGDLDDSDVYFIINKANHIDGTKGKKYYIPCYFYSGYITDKNEEKNADETCTVNLEFEY